MIEAIKKHKRIVAAVVILILTAIIEIECNYQAIRHGYTDLDLSEYITEKNSLGTEKFVVSYAFPQKKLYKTNKIDRIISERTMVQNKSDRSKSVWQRGRKDLFRYC